MMILLMVTKIIIIQINYDDCVYYTNKKANTNIDDELSWQQHYQSTWFLWNPQSCGNEGAFMCQPSNI